MKFKNHYINESISQSQVRQVLTLTAEEQTELIELLGLNNPTLPHDQMSLDAPTADEFPIKKKKK